MKDWIHRTEAVGVEDLEVMARESSLLAPGQFMSPQLLAYTLAVCGTVCIHRGCLPSKRGRRKCR